MEFNHIDEVTPLTDEQWERIISWHRRISGQEVLQGLLAAREFSASIEKLQNLAGHTQEYIGEIGRALLDMTADE